MTPSPLLSHYCTYIYTTPAIYLPSPSRSCSCSSGNLLACFPPLFLRCPLAAALYCLPACLTYSTQLNYITHKLLTYLLTPILSTFTHPPQKSLTMSMASPPPLLLPALLPATHCYTAVCVLFTVTYDSHKFYLFTLCPTFYHKLPNWLFQHYNINIFASYTFTLLINC